MPSTAKVRLMEGASGYGKTSLALSLGARTDRPVVRVEASRCLQANLGESEKTLRLTLAQASLIPGVVVLLDDIDRFLAQDYGGASEAPTLERMSGVFLQWIDWVPESVTVALTCDDFDRLTPQWRRRVQLRITLPYPKDLDGLAHSQRRLDYRRAVFSAVFRKSNLADLSADDALIDELAARTDPTSANPISLHAPMALFAEASALAGQTIQMATGADIEAWVRETILLHGSAGGNVRAADFWRDKLR